MRRHFLAGGLALLTTTLATTLAACSKSPEKKAAEKKATGQTTSQTTGQTTAQTPAAAPKPVTPPPPPPPETVKVSLMTSKGEIILLLEAKKAPLTVANFLHYVDTQKVDGSQFWRAAHAPTSGFVQASITGPTFPPIAHESTKMTGLSHTNGAISMSRFAPGTATGDFILCVGDNTYMDAGREGSEDKLGYAAFGHVIKGMDVVKRILAGRIDSHTREGGWAGQMLKNPVVIISARRVE